MPFPRGLLLRQPTKYRAQSAMFVSEQHRGARSAISGIAIESKFAHSISRCIRSLAQCAILERQVVPVAPIRVSARNELDQFIH